MKNYITPSYSFTPGASGVGTIDTNIVNFNIKLLVGIINITREAPIYWPALAGRGFTNVAGDVITLEYDTSTHNAGDVLQFIYDSTADYPVFSQITNFPATQAVSAASLPLPSGAATETTLSAINTDLGAPADAAASSDTGTFGIIAFIKRAMQNWTTLLGRIPASVSGRVPVDGSGVTQPVSGSVSVSNFPATQPVSGSVSVGNFPATQPVSGSVSVSNFPTTQPVSGPLTNAELATSEVVEALRQIQMEVEVLKNTIGQTRVDSTGRLRVLVDSISASLTLASITTLTTLTNQTQIGGANANDQIPALRRATADTLLSKITIS